jgi:hypothetical protein
MPASDSAAALTRSHLRYLPVVPGRLECAAEVRRTILDQRPAVVAVELPGWLRDAYIEAADRLPEISVIVYPEDEASERAVYLVVEPADPFVEAVRSALESGAEVVFLEPDTIDRPHLDDLYPDTWSIHSLGYQSYVDAYRLHPQPRSDEMSEHAAAMAWRLQGADPERQVLVVLGLNLLDAVLDAMETPQDAPRARLDCHAELVNPHPDCLAQITQEYPFLLQRYEQWRALAGTAPLDRRRVQFELLKEAEQNYQAQTGDSLNAWQRRLLARYTRNLALIDNQLVAGLFDLAAAARSIVDDNFGWEVWNAANAYPWQRAFGPLETVNLTSAEIFLHSRKLRLRRREPRAKQRMMPRGLKRRPKEETPGEWARQLDGNAICSYPPEDVVIEDYGKRLRAEARALLGDQHSRPELFSTSMLDGVDIRETIRNWHQSNLYVRQFERVSGDVGAVVVIFDEDPENRYTYLTTWRSTRRRRSITWWVLALAAPSTAGS